MQDVADRAGVSRALVSIVFRDQPGAGAETRDRVRAAAETIGYRPDHRARLLSRRETRLLGVTFDVGHEFHSDLLVELYAAAADVGYELVLSGVTPGRSENRAVAELQSLRCDALVLLGPSLRAAALTALGRQTPTVTVARAVSGTANVVRTDDVLGAELATRHLLDLGHRRIVHVDGGRAPGAAERRRGYRQAMAAAGLAGLVDVRTGGLSEEDGAAAARRLLAGPDRSTATLVFNDRSAAGYLDVLRSAGVGVPEEHSVVGYDDSRIAHSLWARLTTVGQDTGELARVAVAEAVATVLQPTPRREVLVAPELVVRRTTAPVIDPTGPSARP